MSHSLRSNLSLGLHRAWIILGAVAALLCFAVSAYPAGFDVQPVSIEFSRPGEVTLLTVRNIDDHPLRFQLEAYAWEQNPDGTLKLSDTDDILYFPQLFEIAPGATQNVRVGTTAAPGPVEKTYRIFIEQLPQLTSAEPRVGRGRAIRLQVVPKVGVPIFLRPTVVTRGLQVSGIAVANGTIDFDLRNLGTVHLVPSEIRVEGLDRSGAVAFSRQRPGWYVLAGGLRRYHVPIPSDCASVSDISIQVVAQDGQQCRARAAVSPGACDADSMAQGR